MKKIGLLFGENDSFPLSVIDLINNHGNDFLAEPIKIGAISINSEFDYDIIFDLASHEVPYFKSFLKMSKIRGINIINSPFWTSFDDNFFISSICYELGINLPKTSVIPSKDHPIGVTSDSMRNLEYPLNWDEIFKYIGFPSIIKTNSEIVGRHSYKIFNEHEFFSVYDFTGSKTMMIQEFIDTDITFRCFSIGKTNFLTVPYDGTKPHHLRYADSGKKLETRLRKEIETISGVINSVLDMDFNAIDFAIKENEIFVIEFLNPSPRIDINYFPVEYFNWLVKYTSEFIISKTIESDKVRVVSKNKSKIDRNSKTNLEIKSKNNKNGRKPKIQAVSNENKSRDGQNKRGRKPKIQVVTDTMKSNDGPKKRGRKPKITL